MKYIGVLMMPVAWAGFILDFVARDALVTRRVVGAMGAVAAGLLVLAWTDGSHHLFWGDMRLEGAGSAAVLVGRGPGFWTNITLTYASLVAGIAVLVSQAVQSPVPLSQARDGADSRDGAAVDGQRAVPGG